MSSVQIVEVGLRDGLQNEKKILPLSKKIELAEKLIAANIKRIELGAFVRAEKVPQMADSAEVVETILKKHKNLQASVLVPNERGMSDALKTPIKEVAIFAACTETFSQKNINCSIEESFSRFEPVLKEAKKKKIKVRGYLSVCFSCPYEGNVNPKQVVKLAQRLIKMGCYEVSIGDTLGVAAPLEVKKLFRMLKTKIPAKKLAGHFHDTHGTALANIFAAYELGIRVFDSSVGGLGGCPYAPGAKGNVSTEKVVRMFDRMKVKTGIKLPLPDVNF